MFKVDEYLGVSSSTAVIIISSIIGIIGIIYLFVGGLSLSAFSDSIYGMALIIGGLAITILGLGQLEMATSYMDSTKSCKTHLRN